LNSRPSLTRRRFLQATATLAASSAGDVPALALISLDKPSRADYLAQADILVETLQTKRFRTEPYSQWGDEQNAWNTCNTLEALIDYTQITGNRRYYDQIHHAATDQVLLKKVMGDGVDDEAWAGIVMVKAYRLTKERSCLDAAKIIFDSMTTYWDDTCGGGVWWNFTRTYKNAITNELFLVLATQLYRETRTPLYLEWAKKEWDWFARSGMINADNLINDGLHECKNNNGETWTYNQGVVLGGLVELSRITGDKMYREQAVKIAGAVMTKMSPLCNGVPILQEVGGELNHDQQQFKGIFMRYLANLALVLPEKGTPGRKAIRDYICANATSLWRIARTDQNEINAYWHETERKPIYTTITQTSCLDLLNAALSLTK